MLRAVALLIAVLLATAMAPGAAQAERRVAVVFGTGAYLSLRPLRNPLADAAAVTAELETLGFEVEHEPDRDLRRMRRALRDFEEDAAGAEVAVVFFAGHAVEVGGRNLLLPVDAEVTDAAALSATGLPLEEVVAVARRVARRVLVVVDACRDDPFWLDAGGDTGRGATPVALPGTSGVSPGLRLMGRSEGVVYAFAAAPGETAADGTGANSPFTAALARFLATEGVDVRTALVLVQQDVYDRTRGRQLPYVESGLPEPLFLNPGRAEAGERERLLLAMAGLTPDLRSRIEAAAAVADIPLAPLFAAVLASGEAEWIDEGRLDALAAGIAATQERLRQSAPVDPRAAALRDEALAALELGAFALAREKIDAAVALDRAAGDAAAEVLVARRLAEADSLRVRADILYLAGAEVEGEGFVDAYAAAARAYLRADALARAEGRLLDREALLRMLEALEKWQGFAAWLLTHGAPPDLDALVSGGTELVGLLERLLPSPDAPEADFPALESAFLEGLLYPLEQTRAVWEFEVVWTTDATGNITGEFANVDRGPFNLPAVMALRLRALAWAEAFHAAGAGRPHPWESGGLGTPALRAALALLADARDELGETAEAARLRERAAALP
ncbi:MAG: caspase family protein [Rhodobacteraceae bacterium]|jgi:uncharacterized caspase-like protein|nr:caspase family protein [Paracoccaceae bacterium]